MYAGKPVIGILGGIGSGKSFVAGLFGELGCIVIDSDAQVREAYRDSTVKAALLEWWGPRVLTDSGEVNRPEIARIIFNNLVERARLEALLHPWVNKRRENQMAAAVQTPGLVAFVWDTPLLLEAGLNANCDALVFVEAAHTERVQRVRQSRGWEEAELLRREKLQLPLDTKRQISDYRVVNTADAGYARDQVQEILSRIVNDLE